MKSADPPHFMNIPYSKEDVWAFAAFFLLTVVLLVGFVLGAVVSLQQGRSRRWLLRGVAGQQELLDGHKRRGLRRAARPDEDHGQMLLAQPVSLPKELNVTPQVQMQAPLPPQPAASATSAPASVRRQTPGKQQSLSA